MSKIKVLFVCGHNSARSQMAEAWLNHVCGDLFEASSAGIHPAQKINPHAIQAMKEVGVDISMNRPRSVFDVYKTGEVFHYIITVCDQASAEKCPVFLGLVRQMHWSFSDPSGHDGSYDEKLQAMRKVRNEITNSIEQWCAEFRVG
ncbi:MAG: arsenate reductase ArsC [Desulfomonilia bacterium]